MTSYFRDPVLLALADQLSAQTRDVGSGLVAIVHAAQYDGHDSLTVRALVMRRIVEIFGEDITDRATGIAALAVELAVMLASEVEAR